MFGRRLARENRGARTEVVYNVEPYRAAVREGDWKLVWTTLLPPTIELFDLGKDVSKSKNLADEHPEKVKELQARIIELAKQAKPPLFLWNWYALDLAMLLNFPI